MNIRFFATLLQCDSKRMIGGIVDLVGCWKLSEVFLSDSLVLSEVFLIVGLVLPVRLGLTGLTGVADESMVVVEARNMESE